MLLEVLDEQAGRGDVVAVDDDAVAAGVGAPAVGVALASGGEALDAVVGAPHPGVVDQHVVAVDLERDLGLADVRPADAEVDVAEGERVGCRASVRSALPPFAPDPQQRRRLDGARVDR